LRGKLAWTQDGLTDDESRALNSLTSLTSADPDLGLAVADYSWVIDAISSDEKWALKYLDDLHGQDPTLGALFLRLPWVVDGITEVEKRSLQYIKGIHRENPSAGAVFITLPWLTDGIVNDERWALQYLRDFQAQDLALGTRMLQRPWVTDGITEQEQWSLLYISEVHAADAVLGEALANLSWVQDQITEHERWALRFLKDIHKKDASLGERLASLPWVQDDITRDERWALRYVSDIHQRDPILANQLADMPFFTASLEEHDSDALASILNLKENHPKVLAMLLEQEWYLDGMDDQEAGLVMIVGHRASTVLSPEDLQGFLSKHHAESRTVTMPLAGEITLTFYQVAPDSKNREIVDQVEDAIRVMEGFMGVPFPTKGVFLLLATPGELSLDNTIIGLNRGTHMIVDPSLARQGDNNRVLNHEAAHYYWGSDNAPHWFSEGAADFLSTYVRDQLYDDSFDDRLGYLEFRELRYCNNSTIQKLVDDLERQGLAQHQLMPYAHCDYSEGENLFINLFSTIGSDALSAAWTEIYLIAEAKGQPATELDIYQTLLRHTPLDKVAAFKKTYLKLHGGDFPDA